MSNGVFSADDDGHMRAALGLAERGLGSVWPNPSVGCVLVQRGRVVGRGWTQPGGRPHAETQALAMAGEAARGATAYVTLEPCSHYGKTPPCAEALVAAGISRCVVAMLDSDPRVSGRGVERLRSAGIEVVVGLAGEQARFQNAGFFSRIERGRPLFLLKTATSLDGRIALASGESKWITQPPARALTHRWRAMHDAVLVGIGTALADDPDLTCRLSGVARRSMVRIVLDSQARLPRDSQLVRSAPVHPLWQVVAEGVESPLAGEKGVVVISVPRAEEGGLSIPDVAASLAQAGLTRVMVEGGGQVAAAFLRANLVDRLLWFRSAQIIGGDGRPVVAALQLQQLASSPKYALLMASAVGIDAVELYERR